MTSAIEFQSGVDKLVANLDIADKLVNTDSDVTTGAGVRPSFPKVLREFVDLGTARDEAVAAAEDAVAAADKLTLPSLTYVGRPGDAILVDGTGIGIGATFWRDAVAEDGSLIAIDLFDKAAGTLNLAVYRGAVTALTRVALTTFATTGTGTSRRITLAAPILVQAGDIIAVQSPTTGTYAEGQYATDRAGYTFTGPYLPETVSLTTPPAANTQMQVRFVISYRQQVVTADRFLVAEANAVVARTAANLLTVDAVEFIGRPADAVLENGTAVTTGAIYWRDVVDHAGSFTSLDLFDKVAGTVRVAVYRGAASALTRVALTTVTTNGSGTTRRLTLSAPIAVLPGDIIAVQPQVEGAFSVAQVQSGDAGYTYSYPDLPTTMALDAPTTNGQMQVRFRIEYRDQTVTAATFAKKADAVLKISNFAVLAASTAGPYELSWSIDGVPPRLQRVTWGGWTVELNGRARRLMLPVDWAALRPITFVGNSMSDGNDAEAGGNWSGIYAGRKGVALVNPAKYSQDANKQALRVGAKDIFLTVTGNALPAGGGSVAVTAINGVAPGVLNPDSFLNTSAGDPVTPNNSITGTAAGRHLTISIPNGGSAAYSVTVDAGQTATVFPAGTLFVPDFAQGMGTNEVHIDVGRINFYPAQPILDLVGAMVAQGRGNPITVWPTLPADGDSTTDRTRMVAFNTAQAALWPLLTPKVSVGGVTYDLLSYMQFRGGTAIDPMGNVPTQYHKSGDTLHFNTLGNGIRADFAQLWDAQRVKPPVVSMDTRFSLVATADGLPNAVAVVQPVLEPQALTAVGADLDGVPWLSASAINLTGSASGLAWTEATVAIAKAIKYVSIAGSAYSPTEVYYIGTIANGDVSSGDQLIIRRASDNQSVALAGTGTVFKPVNSTTRRIVSGNGIEFTIDIAYNELASGVLINTSTLTPLIFGKGAIDGSRAQSVRAGIRMRNIALDPAGALGTSSYQGTNVPAQTAAGARLLGIGIAKSHKVGTGSSAASLYKRDATPDNVNGKYAFGAAWVESSDGVNWPASRISFYPYSALTGGSVVSGLTEVIGGYVEVSATLRWYWGRAKLPATGTIALVAYGFDSLTAGSSYDIGGWAVAFGEAAISHDAVNRLDWTGYSSRDAWRDNVDLLLAGAAAISTAAPKLRPSERPWFNSFPNPNLDPLEAAPVWINGTSTVTPASAEMQRRGIIAAVNVGTGGSNRLRGEAILDASASGQFYFASLYAYSADGVTWPAPGVYWYAGTANVGGGVMPNFLQVDANTRLYYATGQFPARSDLTHIRMGVVAVTAGVVAQIGGYTFARYSSALSIDDVIRDEWYPQATRRDAQIDTRRKALSGGSTPFAGEAWAYFGDSVIGDYSIPDQVALLTGATVINAGFGGCRWTPGTASSGKDFYEGQLSMVRLAQAIASGDWSAQETAATELYNLNNAYDKRARVAVLKATDWTKITRLIMSWGTNDWSAGRLLGDPNSTVENEIYGAINLSVVRILGKSPTTQVLLETPMWRGPNAVLGDSNLNPNANGLYLRDVQDAIVARGRFHQVPVIRRHELVGINLTNKATYLGDDLHPRDPIGRNRLAKVTANQMRLFAI